MRQSIPERVNIEGVWEVFDEITKKKGKKKFIVVYASEQDGENIAKVCFEDSVKEDSEIVTEDENQKESVEIKEENIVGAVGECPLEDLKVLENESTSGSEGEEDMAVNNGEKKVVEKKVMHNSFQFL